MVVDLSKQKLGCAKTAMPALYFIICVALSVVSCCSTSAHSSATLSKHYYINLNVLLKNNALNAAFDLMNIPDIIPLRDTKYWQKIPPKIARIFREDTDKLILFGTALARKNGTTVICCNFIKQLIDMDQMVAAKAIIVELITNQFQDEEDLWMQKVMESGNELIFLVYDMAKQYQSNALYGVFMHLFEKMPVNERKLELYRYYLHALSEERRSIKPARIANIVDNFAKLINADYAATDWKICPIWSFFETASY